MARDGFVLLKFAGNEGIEIDAAVRCVREPHAAPTLSSLTRRRVEEKIRAGEPVFTLAECTIGEPDIFAALYNDNGDWKRCVRLE
jgi:hypothetical protein